MQLAFWWDLGIGIPIRTDADKLLATEPSSWLCHVLYESLRQVPGEVVQRLRALAALLETQVVLPEPRTIEHPLLAAVGTAHTCPDKHRHRRISVRSRSAKQFPGLVP